MMNDDRFGTSGYPAARTVDDFEEADLATLNDCLACECDAEEFEIFLRRLKGDESKNPINGQNFEDPYRNGYQLAIRFGRVDVKLKDLPKLYEASRRAVRALASLSGGDFQSINRHHVLTLLGGLMDEYAENPERFDLPEYASPGDTPTRKIDVVLGAEGDAIKKVLEDSNPPKNELDTLLGRDVYILVSDEIWSICERIASLKQGISAYRLQAQVVAYRKVPRVSGAKIVTIGSLLSKVAAGL